MVLSGDPVRAGRVSVHDTERDAAAARALGVRVFEEKASADQARVVAEHRAVQQPEAPGIDEDPGALRTFKHVIAFAGCLFPGKYVLEARAAAGLQPDPQGTLFMVRVREMFLNLSRGRFYNLNHGFLYAAYNAATRRVAGDDITVTGGADGSESATISKMLHSARTAAIRSRMRRNGSRTLHFEN